MTTPGSVPPGHLLVIGESLVDVAPATPAGTAAAGPVAPGARPRPQAVRQLVAMPGGSPANVALGLARLGLPTIFAGRFSLTGLGPWLKDHLASNGVDLAASVDETRAATIAMVTLDPEGRATYAFYGPETADWYWQLDQLPSPDGLTAGPAPLAAVHTGSLVAAFPPGAAVINDWLTQVRARGDVLISFDPNLRPGLAGDFEEQRRVLAAMISTAHLVKASHEDVEALFPGTSPDDAAEGWLAGGALAVVITAGREGARLLHRQGARVRGRPPRVQVVDTIGAGDSFTAGLLASLSGQGLLSPQGLATAEEDQVRAALDYALKVSAITCTRAGADPPSANEVNAFPPEH